MKRIRTIPSLLALAALFLGSCENYFINQILGEEVSSGPGGPPSPAVFTITTPANPAEGGTIQSSHAEAAADTAVTLTVMPGEGYRLRAGSLAVNGGAVPVGGTGLVYGFTMPAAHVRVNAEFEEVPAGTWTISVNPAAGGHIIPGHSSGVPGALITLTVNPDAGYRLKTGSLKVNGGAAPLTEYAMGPYLAGTIYSFTMPAAHVRVDAEFEEVPAGTWTISVNPAVSHGVITPVLSNAAEGVSVALYVQPEPGYRLRAGSLAVNDGAVTLNGYQEGSAWSFTMPAAHVRVDAEFEEVPAGTWSISPGEDMAKGTIILSAFNAGPGEMVFLYALADPGYQVRPGSIQANGGAVSLIPLAADSAWSFIMPAANVIITADFAEIPGAVYRIGVREDITHGFIVPSTFSAAAGTEVSFFAAGDGNYELKPGTVTVSAEGGAVSFTESALRSLLGGALFSFTMPAAGVIIDGEFQEIEGGTYSVWISEYLEHGQISSSAYSAVPGTVVTITVSPDEGYRLKAGTLRANTGRVQIDGSGPDYTFTMPEESVLVSAQFELIPPSYTVTVIPPAGNGTLMSSHTSAETGSTVTLTVTPEEGYRLKAGSLRVIKTDDSPVYISGSGPAYTFTMPASDVRVSAEFELIPPSYTVSVNSSIAYGTVTANHTSAEAGASVRLTVTPEEGYRLKAGSLRVIKTDDSPVTVSGAGSGYTFFTMPASDVRVSAEFELIPPSYTVTVSSLITHGTVTANHTSAEAGASVRLTITPDTGYRLKPGSLKVNDGVVEVSGSYPYTFVMPSANVTVSAEFEAVEYTVAVNASGISHGTVSSNVSKAVMGATVTLTVAPDPGYALKPGSLKTNNAAVQIEGSGSTYTFTMPAISVVITAEFEAITYTVTVSPPANGAVTSNVNGAAMGDAVTLTVTPDPGYALKAGSLAVNGGTVPVGGSGPYTFTMPAAHVTVTAEFEVLSSGGITLTLNDLGLGAFSQATFTVNKGGTPNPAVQDITLTGTWDASPAPLWDIDNGRVTRTGNSITINAVELNKGGHSLTATVYKNGVPWSKTLDFTVAD